MRRAQAWLITYSKLRRRNNALMPLRCGPHALPRQPRNSLIA